MNTAQCFAVMEREHHQFMQPPIPARIVARCDSFAMANHIATVKNGDSIKLDEPNRYYVGLARMR
jgi:hypothetical protein